MEQLDTRNELVTNLIDRLVETLNNIEPQKYTMDKIRQRAGLKIDQSSGKSSVNNDDEDEAAIL